MKPKFKAGDIMGQTSNRHPKGIFKILDFVPYGKSDQFTDTYKIIQIDTNESTIDAGFINRKYLERHWSLLNKNLVNNLYRDR